MRRMLVAVTVLAAAACSTSEGRVDRARGILRDEDGFATAFKAGDSLARVGELLQAEGEACRDDDPGAARCAWLLSASAAAQVMAFRVLDCTAPGRFAARTAMLDHVDALAADDDPGDPPGPPACG